MRRPFRAYLRSQDGYTLVEVIVSAAIGAILLAGLTSVIFSSVKAFNTASSRVEASGQIRNLEYFADDDVARSDVPVGSGCGFPGTPCTTQQLDLRGFQVTNSANPAPAPYEVVYTWDGSAFVDRLVSTTGASEHVATNVTAFDWYVEGSYPAETVVIDITVTVRDYSESQTLRLYPRVDP